MLHYLTCLNILNLLLYSCTYFVWANKGFSAYFTIKDSFNYGPYTFACKKHSGLLSTVHHKHDLDDKTPWIEINEDSITYAYGVEYVSDEIVGKFGKKRTNFVLSWY